MSGLDLGLWITSAGLALYAGWLTLPSAVALDWERLFKITLITQLRGEVQVSGGDDAAWLAAGRHRVYFNPAARALAARLEDPASSPIVTPALPNERALVEELIQTPGVEDRLAVIFGRGADEGLYEDPMSLGPDWDLAGMLGVGADWDALAAWGEPVIAALRRRNALTRWVVVGPSGDTLSDGLFDALREVLGEGRAARLDPLAIDPLCEALAPLIEEPADRLIFIGVGEGAARVVAALGADASLRDRARAVVSVGGALGGEVAARLPSFFTHEGMDTELARLTPWWHLAFVTPGVSPPGDVDQPLAETAWPVPEAPPSGRLALEIVDLGVLPGPRAEYPPRLLARGLLVSLTARLVLMG